MNLSRRGFLVGVGASLGLAACGNQGDDGEHPENTRVDLTEFEDLALDMDAWSFDEENDCYYQLGLPYCIRPAAGVYETLAIFVPGAYFEGKPSGDTYSCEVAGDAKVGKFTPATAPVVMPINSARLSAQASPSAYSYGGLETYLRQGLVYVYAGFRGRSSGYVSDSGEPYSGGAPWPVVDLKAAVRYLRYNGSVLPCNTSRVFVFGYGAGGGVAASVGALGDCGLYTPYLTQIGAATHDAEGASISDAIFGSASWCPVTSFDTADSGYEWMMGQFSDDDTRTEESWTGALSQDLANSYGAYVNGAGLVDGEGGELSLEAVQDGSYLAGSYYDYMMGELEGAAQEFFATVAFPYTYTPGHLVDPAFPGDPNLKEESSAEIDSTTGEAQDGSALSSGDSQATSGSAAEATEGTGGVTVVESLLYDDAESYVTALNGEERWLTYSPSTGEVGITSLWDFVTHCRPAEKGVCAFDAPDRSSTTNQLFGVDDESSLHFDETVSDLIAENGETYASLDGWDNSVAEGWEDDVRTLDSLQTDMSTRVDAMNPLYGLLGCYAGFGVCEVAPHWRINTGLFQTGTALTTETNLVLALGAYEGVEDVSFSPVWGRGFELAEISGDAEKNFVSWVEDCCSEEN